MKTFCTAKYLMSKVKRQREKHCNIRERGKTFSIQRVLQSNTTKIYIQMKKIRSVMKEVLKPNTHMKGTNSQP